MCDRVQKRVEGGWWFGEQVPVDETEVQEETGYVTSNAYPSTSRAPKRDDGQQGRKGVKDKGGSCIGETLKKTMSLVQQADERAEI